MNTSVSVGKGKGGEKEGEGSPQCSVESNLWDNGVYHSMGGGPTSTLVGILGEL